MCRTCEMDHNGEDRTTATQSVLADSAVKGNSLKSISAKNNLSEIDRALNAAREEQALLSDITDVLSNKLEPILRRVDQESDVEPKPDDEPLSLVVSTIDAITRLNRKNRFRLEEILRRLEV